MGNVVELKCGAKKVEPVAIKNTNMRENIADVIAYTHLNLLFDLMNRAKEEKRESITLNELEELPQKAIDKVVEQSIKKLEELEKAEKENKNG